MLSNNLEIKRTPVGASAFGYFVEAGYNVFNLWAPESWGSLVAFMRYDSYDTQYKTEGSVLDDPLWEKSVITGGVNYFPVKSIVFKCVFGSRSNHSTPDDPEKFLALTAGFSI